MQILTTIISKECSQLSSKVKHMNLNYWSIIKNDKGGYFEGYGLGG